VLVPPAPAAELVEDVLFKTVVDDDLMLLEEIEVLLDFAVDVLVVDLLELEVVEVVIVEVLRVVELALVAVEVLPLAVAVAGGNVPEGAP